MNPDFWNKKKKAPKFPKEPTVRRTIDNMPHRDLEDKLDDAFSQFIRMSAAGDSGMNKCVTCGKWDRWKDMDNGHYISRAIRVTRWDEMNCAPQCPKCNRFMDGQKHIFRAYLIGLHGEAAIVHMEQNAILWGETRQPSEWMIERIRYYRAKIKALK